MILTPTRALEIHDKACAAYESGVGVTEDVLTVEENSEVHDRWGRLNGCVCWLDALRTFVPGMSDDVSWKESAARAMPTLVGPGPRRRVPDPAQKALPAPSEGRGDQ